MRYGQFCPISKAAEILCERWTLLIVRELLLGSSRYNEFQKALSRISPTLLSKRLSELEAANLVFKKKIPGSRGYEYFLTQAGNELGPIVTNLGEWGMHWARDQMDLEDLDIELLMWDIRRRLDKRHLPPTETILKFHFTDLQTFADWWIVIDGNERDLCTDDPGKEVDLYFTSDAQTMVDLWQGDIVLNDAINERNLKIVGDSNLKKSVKKWFSLSLLADHGRAATGN